jgi:hypothetical protein
VSNAPKVLGTPRSSRVNLEVALMFPKSRHIEILLEVKSSDCSGASVFEVVSESVQSEVEVEAVEVDKRSSSEGIRPKASPHAHY